MNSLAWQHLFFFDLIYLQFCFFLWIQEKKYYVNFLLYKGADVGH